ncbi:hypothetical protein M9X92_000731 [Pyricularia oryzae]|nr:hypothetical protein M9X92_000731 [Pyricularia oryzae]
MPCAQAPLARVKRKDVVLKTGDWRPPSGSGSATAPQTLMRRPMLSGTMYATMLGEVGQTGDREHTIPIHCTVPYYSSRFMGADST